jgi:hypothetical protein
MTDRSRPSRTDEERAVLVAGLDPAGSPIQRELGLHLVEQ